MEEKLQLLDEVATSYHMSTLDDMYIEEECQLYEIGWILKNISKGSDVLDLGFGDGINFGFLCEHANITLVEGSALLVEKANSLIEKRQCIARVKHSLFEKFESEGLFDVIVMSHVLEHVDDPHALLCHLYKLLRPAGVIVGVVPNADSFHRRLGVELDLQRTRGTLSKRDLLVGHQRVYTLSSLTEQLNSASYKILETRGFFLKPFANSQMLWASREVIRGLLRLSDDLQTECCANIGFIAGKREFRSESSE
jgi:2-polyprenyl-3-methyl-5-hydroxy-6-metoxy-1,4-benzoquinol methylase